MVTRPAIRPQFTRFVIVGLANTATTYGILWLLHAGLGASVAVASASGYIVGALQGFLLSRYWTFAHPDVGAHPEAGGQHGAVAPQLLGFALVNLACAALFAQLVVLFDRALPLPLATVLATALVLPVSFSLYRWLVFRHKHTA